MRGRAERKGARLTLEQDRLRPQAETDLVAAARYCANDAGADLPQRMFDSALKTPNPLNACLQSAHHAWGSCATSLRFRSMRAHRGDLVPSSSLLRIPPLRHEMMMQPELTDTTTSAVQTLVLYSLAEHQLGHAKSIRVTASGHSFSVQDDGRGHAVGRLVDGSPYLDFIYCHLDFPYADRMARQIQLQGLGMSLLNRLCLELQVTVRKPQVTLNLRFRCGQLLTHEVIDTKNPETGNAVCGVVHPGTTPMPADENALHRWLSAVRAASPSLLLHFNGQPIQGPAGGDLYLPEQGR